MNLQTSEATTRVDPITLQVMTNAIYCIADEMMAALVRTSFSTNIKDRRDCSGAVFTRDCELVAQGEIGTPLHLGVMLPTVQSALRVIPPESLEPGDDIIINTPYPQGPGHLNDVSIVSPAFYEGELVGFLANMAHHVDVGGFAPGSMPFGVWEHYQEGLQIPPVLICRRDKLDEQMLRFISKNVRTPVEFKGDLTAQIAANNVGEQRLQALMAKYGKDTVLFYMQALMNYSERRLLSAIKTLPRGSHSYTDFLEGDGLVPNRFKIGVTVTVEDGRIVADFSDSDRQTLGPLNCRPPSTKACVYYVVKTLLDPGLPPNSGFFRPISVVTKPGTLLEVEYPGACCNANIVTTQRIVDALMGAFAQILPDRVSGACSGTMNLLNIGARNPRTGLLYNYIETYGGGQGALADRDGTSGVQNHMTNTRNAPVEVIESAYPLFIHRYGLVPESAGAGRFRGGYGMFREFEIHSERTTVTLSSDRFEIGPWGLRQGLDAQPGSCTIVHRDGSREKLPSKVTCTVGAGDRLISVTPGGGGQGDPYQRSPELVRRDVVEELIAPKTALEVYGVVLRDDLTVDEESTRRRRQHRR
ncbi:MAG: hydantoinase B/oxoprolinase family protein [Acidimicrobiia bacterium]|nr:hydantoinase B/oxoprolinase family protein [Acidimicrobiia bacterium]